MANEPDSPTDSTTPFETVQWDLVARRTVVVVIDAQNDFLHDKGWYAEKGIDITHMQRSIEPIKQLLDAARKKDIPIVWTRHGTRDEKDGGPFMRLRPFLKEGGLRQNTWGYELLDELGAGEQDWFVEKNRLSAFYCTNLELVLRGLDAETVLFTGVLTNQCVAATTKDAMFRDFIPIVVEECTGTTMPHLHDPAIEMMSVGWAEVRGLDDAIASINELGVP